MASSKISELVDGIQFEPGDETIIVRNGANFKVDPTKNAVQAWVNFNGTGTVAIRASYNVSSITDNGAGDYTVNFTNALADINYGQLIGSAGNLFASEYTPSYVSYRTTSSIRIGNLSSGGSAIDPLYCSVAIIR